MKRQASNTRRATILLPLPSFSSFTRQRSPPEARKIFMKGVRGVVEGKRVRG